MIGAWACSIAFTFLGTTRFELVLRTSGFMRAWVARSFDSWRLFVIAASRLHPCCSVVQPGVSLVTHFLSDRIGTFQSRQHATVHLSVCRSVSLAIDLVDRTLRRVVHILTLQTVLIHLKKLAIGLSLLRCLISFAWFSSSLSFNHRWRVSTNWLDHFNLILSRRSPVVDIVVWVLLLQTSQNRLIFVLNLLLLFISESLVKSPLRVSSGLHNWRHFSDSQLLFVLWEILARTCENARHSLQKNSVRSFNLGASVCKVKKL